MIGSSNEFDFYSPFTFFLLTFILVWITPQNQCTYTVCHKNTLDNIYSYFYFYPQFPISIWLAMNPEVKVKKSSISYLSLFMFNGVISYLCSLYLVFFLFCGCFFLFVILLPNKMQFISVFLSSYCYDFLHSASGWKKTWHGMLYPSHILLEISTLIRKGCAFTYQFFFK